MDQAMEFLTLVKELGSLGILAILLYWVFRVLAPQMISSHHEANKEIAGAMREIARENADAHARQTQILERIAGQVTEHNQKTQESIEALVRQLQSR